jgi:hypothetical protein
MGIKLKWYYVPIYTTTFLHTKVNSFGISYFSRCMICIHPLTLVSFSFIGYIAPLIKKDQIQNNFVKEKPPKNY